jgi:DNA-binding MarR family transcriptional regulator
VEVDGGGARGDAGARVRGERLRRRRERRMLAGRARAVEARLQVRRPSHARAHGALERALREYDLGVSEFEVLERLAAAGDGEQRRVQELADAVHLSQSALSRVVARLEQDGLARRGMCHEDRRGIYVCITGAGRARYAAARPAHRAALAETLGNG